MSEKAFIEQLKENMENRLEEVIAFHEPIFVEKLNKLIQPGVSGYSTWSEFRQKFLKKELFLDFRYHSDNVKTYCPSVYKTNNMLLNFKWIVTIGIITSIIITKNYNHLILFLVPFIASFLMTARKDRRLLILLFAAAVLLVTASFFSVSLLFLFAIFCHSALTYGIHQNHDFGLSLYASINQFNFLELLEHGIIIKIEDQKSKISHYKV